MQDPRLRLLAVIALSAIAFASVRGAVLAFAWWVCTLEVPVHLWRSRWPLIVFLPLVAVSLVLLVTGGNWASYSLRIAVVLLIAIFAYQDQAPGEFLGVCTWLLGERAGFDCGLAGEISIASHPGPGERGREGHLGSLSQGNTRSAPLHRFPLCRAVLRSPPAGVRPGRSPRGQGVFPGRVVLCPVPGIGTRYRRHRCSRCSWNSRIFTSRRIFYTSTMKDLEV